MIPGSRHWVFIWGLYGTSQNQFRKNQLLVSSNQTNQEGIICTKANELLKSYCIIYVLWINLFKTMARHKMSCPFFWPRAFVHAVKEIKLSSIVEILYFRLLDSCVCKRYSLISIRPIYYFDTRAIIWHGIVCWFMGFSPFLFVAIIKLFCTDMKIKTKTI